MTGKLWVKDLNQSIYRCDGIDFMPVLFKDIIKDDAIKLDLTQNSVYIVMDDYYNDGIDVKKSQSEETYND